MSTALVIAGISCVAISLMGGIFSGSFYLFLCFVLPGIAFSLIFFALSYILDNQKSIMCLLTRVKTNTKNTETILCPYCGKTYTSDYNSCPYCGKKPS